jgi:hypothetical protein
MDFQSIALPTELPRRGISSVIKEIPENPRDIFSKTGAKGFEPSTSGVTGQHPKPLDHAPMFFTFLRCNPFRKAQYCMPIGHLFSSSAFEIHQKNQTLDIFRYVMP